MNFLERLYKKKENLPCDFRIDDIDVDSYFFHNFLDVYVVQKKVLRLSKGLFRETYSIKEFVFDPHFVYQSYKLTAELHLTRKEVLFILENLKLLRKVVRCNFKDSFYSLSNSQIFQNSLAKVFIPLKIFQRFALKNSSTLSYPLKSPSKSKNLTICSKISNFSSII